MVRNFTLRRTTVQNSTSGRPLSLELHFKADHYKSGTQTIKSRIPLRGRLLSGTSFRGGLLSLKLHFEADQFNPELHFKVQNLEADWYFEDLEEVDQVISKVQNSNLKWTAIQKKRTAVWNSKQNEDGSYFVAD
ncbi:hypothetical protein RclHR1_04070018 [Rhizophagus clarus]|uniref:Uncharacterized protein n=1 Tax=Rhizophagus clarus TaxID=94130 RepID=A0A2Z6REQ5_9GLOM|nr:hypothetical protein RclHR1_04070018 [Rhizophagus clarus]